MAAEPGVPAPENVPPILVPPEPGTPVPTVPPVEDDRPPDAPVQLPGRPGLPERV